MSKLAQFKPEIEDSISTDDNGNITIDGQVVLVCTNPYAKGSFFSNTVIGALTSSFLKRRYKGADRAEAIEKAVSSVLSKNTYSQHYKIK